MQSVDRVRQDQSVSTETRCHSRVLQESIASKVVSPWTVPSRRTIRILVGRASWIARPVPLARGATSLELSILISTCARKGLRALRARIGPRSVLLVDSAIVQEEAMQMIVTTVWLVSSALKAASSQRRALREHTVPLGHPTRRGAPLATTVPTLEWVRRCVALLGGIALWGPWCQLLVSSGSTVRRGALVR